MLFTVRKLRFQATTPAKIVLLSLLGFFKHGRRKGIFSFYALIYGCYNALFFRISAYRKAKKASRRRLLTLSLAKACIYEIQDETNV